MKKIYFIGIAICVFLAATMPAYASTLIVPANDVAKTQAKISANAPIEQDATGQWIASPPGLEKITLIDYANGYTKVVGATKPRAPLANYALLGKGVKWRNLPVRYVINPSNLFGFSETQISETISLATQEWDSNTSALLFDGSYAFDVTANWDDTNRDDRNEISFGNYPEHGVIAITSIWGYFGGPLNSRQIVEFDVLFDNDFFWGNADVNLAVMDFQNIATHELGHGFGLDDLYYAGAMEETMYGYSTEGETKKRTLNAGDIAGIQAIYGGI